MRKEKGNIYLLFYFIISLLLGEIILKASTTGGFSGIVFSLLFSVSFSIIFYVICSIFVREINYILSLVFLGLSTFLFASQMIYYKFFNTFYSVYSAGNASQIFEFWKDIGIVMIENSIWIVLFFLPTILMMVFGKKVLSFQKTKKALRLVLVCCAILSHIINLVTIYFSGRDQYSAYDLYFKNSNPIVSTQKLGLLTTMRLDLKRQILGWSPALEAAIPNILPPPVLPNAKAPEPDDKIPKGIIEKETPGDAISGDTLTEEKIEYNTMDINFAQLISIEENEIIKNMHKYFERVQPTIKNKYTGKYQDYNLIFITAESFSPYAIHESVTPTLYKMLHEGYNFTNFYNPLWGVSTSDGEYVACTSLIPKNGVWSFYQSAKIDMPFVMGNQLKNLGYKTMAYHNHTHSYYRRDVSHPNMGYDYKGVGKGLVIKKTWPGSDLEMMEKTVSEYIDDQPFHAYYMTVSGHMRYSFSGNSMASKNQEYVKNLPFSEAGKAYMATQVEFDRAMEYLLAQLEEAGIADKTLIAISADHYPYGLENEEVDELAGHKIEENFELYKSPFILYTKGMEPMTVDKPCSSLDIIPTLSNMLGLEFDSRLLMGTDIFSNSEPLVIFLNHSFITDKGRYNAITKEFVPIEGVEFDADYIENVSAIINGKFYYSAKILETDYYKKVLQHFISST